MTLQVAMIGTDGIVLGSDQRNVVTVAEGEGVASGHLTNKIFYNKDLTVMAAWSGEDPAKRLASEIVNLSDSELCNLIGIEAHSDRVYQEECQRLGVPHNIGDVILVRATDLEKIYRIHVQEKSACCAYYGKVITGHFANPAIYFLERFYRESEKWPIKRLTPLIAHVILEGGKINPWGIEGLEIAQCFNSGIRKIEKNEREELEAMSKGVSTEISRYLTPMVAD